MRLTDRLGRELDKDGRARRAAGEADLGFLSKFLVGRTARISEVVRNTPQIYQTSPQRPHCVAALALRAGVAAKSFRRR